MKFLLIMVKAKSLLIFIACVVLLLSCKKETKEITVDAFKDIQFSILQREKTYQLSFTLQPFTYYDYGIRISADKGSLFTGSKVEEYAAYPIDKDRYGLFINTLGANKVYFYQIFVRSSSTSNRIFSDVYSFSTNP